MPQFRKFWTQQEDRALTQVVLEMTVVNWTLVSHKLFNISQNFNRNSKQCRQRWVHHLEVSADQQPWNQEEQNKMMGLFISNHNAKNKWKLISQGLNRQKPAQTKNHFNALVRRGLRRMNNVVKKKVQTEKIRRLKPKTLSKILEGKSSQDSQNIIQIIFKLASMEEFKEKTTFSLENIQQILLELLLLNTPNDEKQGVQEEENQLFETIKARRLSAETSDHHIKMRKRRSFQRNFQKQTLNNQEKLEDVGYFLNIQPPVSEELQFQSLLLH